MKKLLLTLCILASLGLLAACNRGQAEGQNGTSTDEHITYTWWMIAHNNDFYTDYSYNPVNRYLEHRFNVSFQFEQPVAGTESDSLALMMGTGSFTDAMHMAVYTGSVPQLYYDGIIVDIAQWLSYMPNLSAMLEDPNIARGVFDDQGRILTLPTINNDRVYPWSGLMYRHDILEMMTGDNVQFPSGNEAPTTIADWEYMLPLFQAFFEMAGFADSAPLVLPANGILHFGELMNSFGAYHLFYIREGTVYAGILEPAMFKYVSTMRDWFERGWIHQDFASRTTDMFFMPNPPLVFGGAAGAWFGMRMHLGDRMSMPEFGMYFDVRPMQSPIAPGITHRDMLRRSEGGFGQGLGNAVYTGNPDIGRFLTAMDILYSEEGGRLRTLGLRADQIAPHDTIMAMVGMTEGSYWFDDNGNVVLHPYFDEVGGDIALDTISGIRFPGIQAISYVNQVRAEEMIIAQDAWSAQDSYTITHPLPDELSLTIDESTILSTNNLHITDHVNQMVTMFIMGTTPLNEATWEEFLSQLRAFGIEENRDIWQAAYDRYMARGQ